VPHPLGDTGASQSAQSWSERLLKMEKQSPSRLSGGVGPSHFIVLKRGHPPPPPEWDLYKMETPRVTKQVHLYKIGNSFEKANIYSYKFAAKASITLKWEAPTYCGA